MSFFLRFSNSDVLKQMSFFQGSATVMYFTDNPLSIYTTIPLEKKTMLTQYCTITHLLILTFLREDQFIIDLTPLTGKQNIS